ncbi:MAG: ABC transporter ATP-binding protein, partial [Nitriliruptorales bacterium]|nr:ABC transporter ATP-binding protein [Nitriliruptorales bacterium]
MVLDQLRSLIRPKDGPAVVVEGLTETFRLYHERPTGLKERLYRFRRSSWTDFDALRDINLSVEQGESVAIIGPNGSGKSTLLKVLARILPPDRGEVLTNGRVASLLELGAGFHGDLTGRENIYLNGAILGLSRARIRERFDEIVDFAGIDHLLDTPVRTYSSGLYVRLGFAIAVTVDPDILLVDEVLSVGDAAFQARSLHRMQQFKVEGKTLLIVSHDLDALVELCDRAIVLDAGRIAFDGPIREGVELYKRMSIDPQDRARLSAVPSIGSKVRIEEATLLDQMGRAVTEIDPSAPLRVRVRLVANEYVEACSVGATVEGADGMELYEVHTGWQGVGVGPLVPGQTVVVDVRFVAHLLAGHYAVAPVVTDPGGRLPWASLPRPLEFRVRPGGGAAGLVDLQGSTSVTEGPAVPLRGG